LKKVEQRAKSRRQKLGDETEDRTGDGFPSRVAGRGLGRGIGEDYNEPGWNRRSTRGGDQEDCEVQKAKSKRQEDRAET
jgi:hypothetical protein